MKPGKSVYQDKSKKPHRIHRKITPNVEEAILLPRDSFNWSTQRIMIALRSPPPYIQFFLEETTSIEWKPVKLSRQNINNVLKKHGVNGSLYRKNRKAWKYFRAKKPNDIC